MFLPCFLFFFIFSFFTFFILIVFFFHYKSAILSRIDTLSQTNNILIIKLRDIIGGNVHPGRYARITLIVEKAIGVYTGNARFLTPPHDTTVGNTSTIIASEGPWSWGIIKKINIKTMRIKTIKQGFLKK